jgi:hypothetical protein
MATVNKDFKVKNGLIVEGLTATVNNFDILTKKQADQDYIVGLIGGTSTSANTANTVVKRDASGNFAAGTITANVTGNVTGTVSSLSNHDTADLAEGTNLYFTDERAQDAIGNNLGTGLSYNDSTGAVSVTANTYDAYGAAAAAQSAAASDATSKVAAEAALRVSGDAASVSTAAADATSKVSAEAALRVSGDAASVATAASDATSKANAAQAAAISAAATALTNHEADTTNVHGIADTSLLATTANVATAKTEAIAAAASASTSAISAAIATEVSNRNTAIADAVDDLVDGAPSLLNTLNELAAAINDDANYTTTITTALGTKAPLASPALTGVPTAPTAAADTSTTQIATTAFAKAEADAAQSAAEATASADATSKANAAQSAATTAAATDATTKANAAQAAAISAAATDATTKANNAKSGAEATAASALSSHESDTTNIHGIADTSLLATTANVSTAVSTAASDATSKANAAQAAAIAYADALTTSDVAEGSSLYHTTARAKSAAADLLTGATLTNITITGSGSGLVITAENGVADSTTTNLAEGTNLYFTNARAVTALEAVVPNFTEVDINSLATQVAATISVPTASASNVAYAFAKASYRSAEFLVKTSYGVHTEISKVLLTLDTADNIAITEYGTIGTNGSAMSISAGISGANVQLLVTTTNNSSTVRVVGTLLA